jgi:o-succinylbenzoate synthase
MADHRAWLAPRLLGRAIDAPGAVHDILAQDVRGHNMAKAALEMGCWALAAAQAGCRSRDSSAAPASRSPPASHSASSASPEALVAKATAALAEGYQKVKIKIAPGP